MNVTQKVGKEVRYFWHDIWYICSWSGAVNLTDETESSIGLHLAKYLSCVHLSSTRSIRLVLLFLLTTSPRQGVTHLEQWQPDGGCYILSALPALAATALLL